MATPAQIEANRRNAQASTGPTSPDGKVASSRNSWKHGMAGGGKGVLEGMEAAFEERRAAWAEVHRPEGDFAAWVLDRVVAASFRIELCERSLDAHVAYEAFRAARTWDSDRRLEALEVADRLPRSPARVTRRLEATAHGCDLMIHAWEFLARSLEAEGGWNEAEASHALDLLGVDPDARSGVTPIDDPDGLDPLDHRRRLCRDELALLVARKEVLDPIDAIEREQTESGAFGLRTKSVRLVERYERDAWRRLRDGMDTLRQLATPDDPTPAPADPIASPAPAPTAPDPVAPPVAASPAPAPSRPAVAPAPASRPMAASPASTYIDFAITPTPLATVPAG